MRTLLPILLFSILGVRGWSQSAPDCSVVFRGTDFFHLTYHGVADQANDYKVSLLEWGGSVTGTIELDSASGTPPLVVEGVVRRVVASDETRSYAVAVYAKDPLDPEGDPIVRVLASTGGGVWNRIEGTLALDESISAGTLEFGPVTIPAGRKLIIDADQLNQGQIDVHGQLVLRTGIRLVWNSINLHSRNDYANIEGGTIRYYPGSEGSILQGLRGPLGGASYQNVEVSADGVTLRNGEQVQVQVGTATDVVLENLIPVKLVADPGAGTIRASHCEFLFQSSIGNPVTSDQHPMLEASWCVFRSGLTVGSTVGLKWDTVKVHHLFNVTAQSGAGLTPAEQTFKDCYFEGVWLYGAKASLERCEIGRNPDHYQTNLGSCASLTFRDCVFSENVVFTEDWSVAGGAAPVISGCSFLGQYALSTAFAPTSPIRIGPNYYGDSLGPTLESAPTAYLDNIPFLCNRGAAVHYRDATLDPPVQYFDLETPLKEGRERAAGGAFPAFWLAGYIAGQNTISHDGHGVGPRLRRDRDTLVSLDIVCTDDDVEGARVYATANGVPVGGVATPTLFRDAGKAPGGAMTSRHGGTSTVNLVIPPLNVDTSVIRVFLDTTQVQGYDTALGGGSVTEIATIGLAFDRTAVRRPLRFVVVPVELRVPFFPTGTPDAAAVAARLDTETPELFPIRDQDHIVTIARPQRFYGIVSSVCTTCLLNWIGTELKLGEAFLNTTMLASGAESALDFVVAVLPGGSMGTGVEGANLPLRRSVLFVDENYPEATWHEMGHAIGLYNGWRAEQYHQVAPNGIRVGGVTSFLVEGRAFPQGFRDRLLHHPAEGTSWFVSRNRYDIMGDRPLIWGIPSTVEAFHQYLVRRIDGDPAPRQPATQAAKPYAAIPMPVQQGYRRLQIYGQTEPQGTGTSRVFRIIPETVRCFNTTPVATGWVPPPESTAEGARYEVVGYRAGGSSWVFRADAVSVPSEAWGDSAPERDFWIFTADVPPTVERVDLVPSMAAPIFSVQAAPGLACAITSPQTGHILSDGLTAVWEVQGNPAQLMSLVLLSVDGGTTWKAVDVPTDDTALTSKLDEFSPSNNVSLRVLVSDGIQVVEDRVDGLIIPDRAPRVRIVQPPDGSETAPDVPIVLSGTAWDYQEGALDRLYWTSSRDGDLGNSPTLVGITFSEGDHTITCTARNSRGLESTSQMTLHVQETSEIDLALDRRDVDISGSREGPQDTHSPLLTPGRQHGISLRVRNTGVPTTATVSLEIVPPSGPALSLGEWQLRLEPFEIGTVDATYAPTLPGRYTLWGTLLETDPPDRNPGNNVVEVSILGGHSPRRVREVILGLEIGDPDLDDANGDGILDIADCLEP